MRRAPIRGISIRIKLAVFAGAVLCFVVLGQSFQNLASQAVIVQEDISLQARLVIMSVSGAVGSLWTAERVPDMQPFGERISKDLEVRSLSLLSAEGEVLAYYGEAPSREEVQQVTRLRLRTLPRSLWGLVFRPLEYEVASPVMLGSEVRGYLLCAFRSDEPTRRLRELVVTTLWSMLLWMSLGAGLTLWVSRRLSEPLEKLARDLSHAESEGYSLPLEGPADGEIGLVQMEIASLSVRLLGERQQVQELTSRLRHQVEVVSADLAHDAAHRQAILDSVRDGILLVDEQGVVIESNRAALRLFGRRLSGHPIHERVNDPEQLHRALDKALRLSEAAMVVCEVGKGEVMHYRIRIAPVHVEPDEEKNAVLVVEDVTESRRLQEQMMRSERLASMGTLTAGIAHQVGNHLSGIKAGMDLLALQLKGQDAALEDVDRIRREVRASADLLKRIMLVARTRPPTNVSLHIPTVLADVVDVIRPQAEAQNIELDVALAEPGCCTEGDPQLLFQALLNFAVNAVQAMPDGGRLSIRSACTRKGQCAVIIEDSGPGMDEEVRGRVFEPFFTTKPEGEGTGLGLAIAQRIVELHRGVVRVESAPDRGTRIAVVLQVDEENPEHCDPAKADALQTTSQDGEPT